MVTKNIFCLNPEFHGLRGMLLVLPRFAPILFLPPKEGCRDAKRSVSMVSWVNAKMEKNINLILIE
jgi:hypothetical protein